MSDSGTPFVLSLPEELPVVQTYHDIAQKVNQEVTEIESGNSLQRMEARYDPVKGKVLIEEHQDAG